MQVYLHDTKGKKYFLYLFFLSVSASVPPVVFFFLSVSVSADEKKNQSDRHFDLER